MKKVSVAILSFIISITVLSAEHFSVIRQYDIVHGISDNTIRSIIQDTDGFIWFGTKDGINRFNGRDFKRFGGYPKTKEGYQINVLKLLLHSDGHRIWVGAVDGLYLFDDNTGDFSIFAKQSSNGKEISQLVNDLCYDEDGRLWIASSTGLFRYDEKDDVLVDYTASEEKGSIPDNEALALMKDSSGDIWIGTTCGLSLYNEGLDKFVNYVWKRKSQSDYPYEICQMTETDDGEIWIATRYDGLLRFDRLSGRFTTYKVSPNGTENTWIRTINLVNNSTVMLGTEDGLFIFDRDSETIQNIKSIRQEAIYSLLIDHEGGLWIGTYFDGVYYVSPQSSNVKWYHENQGQDSMMGKAISQFCEDEHGNIWVATEDNGLNHFNVNKQTFKNLAPPILSHNNIHALLKDGDRLWIGTFSQGIDILDTKTGKVTRNYRHEEDKSSSLPHDHVYTIYKDSKGTIYIGTMRGFCKYVPGTDSFHSYKQMKDIFVYDMMEDDRGDIWIATKNDGVWRFDGKDFMIYRHEPGDTASIGNNHIIRVHKDIKGNIWFATEGNGISRYDYENNAFVNYDFNKGLYHHIIYGILDDQEGNLWLSSNYGIVRYNPQTYESQIYTHEDGLQSNQFNYRSSFKSSDGTFYFGGINGFNTFKPDKFHKNTVKPQVVFSDIILHESNSESEVISAHGKNEISIEPGISSMEVSFNCLSYVSPSRNRYAYRMNRLHDDWIYTDKSSVTFMNPASGHYTLMVKAANNDGIWSEPKQIGIYIKPPLWKSGWAIFLYILILGLLGLIFIRWYNHYISKERDREKQRMEMEMEQEIYRSKFQFFTHIAHEIKTPLSLIKAPLEAILEEGKWSNDTHENLLVMHQNTDRLMELIMQLLNFQKIDKEGYRIHYSNINLNGFIRSIVQRFSVSSNKICIDALIPDEQIQFCTDSEALTKVMSNLLANGLKYAKSRILVRSEIEEVEGKSYMTLSIEDDGPGISENEVEKIFEPFYRSSNSDSENGFGIGLSLVRLLIEKLGGNISACNSGELGGMKVSLRIPQGTLDNTEKDSSQSMEEKVSDISTETVSRNNILIVDDTKEILDFLIKNLSSKFNVYGALNGKEALDVLRLNAIDLIVSDIMMPEMDGFELLLNVRSDKMLSHIPFILLSAQGNVNSKITGLDYGADAYIEKPFSINHIKATIDNLLKNRKALFEKFAKMPSLDNSNIDIKNHDINWLEQVTDIIKKNLTNELFNVDILADEMALSRSSLRRKILGVTGLAPNDYIRLVRLKMAAELMRQGKYRVNEVAYLVGFSNHSYFARCFLKQFGMLPKDYIKAQGHLNG